MLIRLLKKLFGIYETGYEYWVPTDQIIITPDFARTRIGTKKWIRKRNYYMRTGRFESQIVLTKDFVLINGYSSYKLAKRYGEDKVPVVFAEYIDEQVGGYIYMAESNKKSVPVYEQETHISYMRDELFAKVYTSDTTQMTKYDKLCKQYPDMWSCVSDDGYSKSYMCKDKKMISARGQKRKISDKQKEAFSKRMKLLREGQKNDNINSESATL